MNLNVHVVNGMDCIGLQVFDHLYAYQQSQHPDYKTNLTVEFSEHKNIKLNSINILFTHMPHAIISDIDDYDLVLLDNGDEPLEVATEVIYNTLINYKHSYLIANAFLQDSHKLKSRIIVTMSDANKFNDYQNKPFYPQYYQSNEWPATRSNNVGFMTGTNKAHRWHMTALVQQYISEIQLGSTLTGEVIHETSDCFFESREDAAFREWVNAYYPIVRTAPDIDSLSDFYNIFIGIDNKFGMMSRAYFFLEEYFNFNCIVFPESSWINGELSLTEKAIKCFYSGAFPLSVGGAGINQLYNALRFKTAWNLLPAELQNYDSIDNHQERYQKIIPAMQWLENNPQVFDSAQANTWRTENQLNILKGKFSLYGARQLDEILKNL